MHDLLHAVARFVGEALLAFLIGNSFRHRPRQQHPVVLEAEVVVQASRGVALDDEDRIAALALALTMLENDASSNKNFIKDSS